MDEMVSSIKLNKLTYLLLCRRHKDKKEDKVEPEADPERDQRTVFAYQVCLLL